MRTATLRLEDMKTTIINMGYVGENEHKQIRFDGKKMFQEYPNASVSLTVCPACGEAYPATIERDGDFVLWTITDSDLVAEGYGEIQLTFTESPHIAKSYICRTKVLRSLVPTGDIPSGLDDFITRAGELLEQVEDTFPAGGTTGQVLAKKSNADYDTEWVDQEAGTVDYTDLTNKPQIGGVTLTGNKSLHDLGAATEEAVSAKYTKPSGGIPASDIASGVIPVLTDLIDDTAGDGDTDKVWSADKSSALLTEINSIMIIGNPVTIDPDLNKMLGFILADGSREDTSSWHCSDYVDISDANERKVFFRSTLYGGAGTAWYDSEKRCIGYLNGGNASDYGLVSRGEPQEYNLTLPADAKYVRISTHDASTTAQNDMLIEYVVLETEPGEALQPELNKKVNVSQGVENAGKTLVVGVDGNVGLSENSIDNVADDLYDLIGQDSHSVQAVFDIIDNKLIYQGTPTASSMWECSDYIDISEANGHSVTIKSTVYGIAETAWYDDNKTLIDVMNGNNASSYGVTASDNYQTYTMTFPDTAKYIRISGFKEKKQTTDALEVTYQTSPITGTLETDLAGKADKTDADMLKSIVGDPEYMNLVDPIKIVADTYINGSTGVRSESAYYKTSDFMLLKANTLYYVGDFYIGTETLYHAFYSEPDESSFIENPDLTLTRDASDHCTILVGATDVYARFSALKAKTNMYVSAYVDYYVAFSGPITLKEMVTPKCRFKKILVMGDSISTDYYGNYKKWVSHLIDEGFFPEDVNNDSVHATGFVARYNNQPNDFISRVTAIDNPETYDLVVVFGGINDANALIPMGTDSDTDYTTYLNPAVRYFYKYVCTNFINARIAVLTPLPCSTQNRDPSVIGVQYTNSAFFKQVAESYSLPVLDLTNHSGFNPDGNKPGIDFSAAQAFRMRWTLKVGDYDPDGIHPTEEYEKKFLAPMIKKFIESL